MRIKDISRKVIRTTLLTLGILSIGAYYSSARAAQGVTIVYSSTLTSIGGGGGGPFGTITCPSGQLISGFDFWNSSSGGSLDGLAIRGKCSALSVSGTSASLIYQGVTAVGGPVGGTFYSGSCPADQVVTGVDAQATQWPVLGWFRLYCSPISYNATTQQVTIQAAPASPSTSIIGPTYSYGGTYYNRIVAPSGSAIAGFSGRSGAALDQINFNAYTINQSALTLNASVNGGSATASSFTLTATDTSSIATNFTSGTTNIMTPSTYTLSWSGPSGYVLSSISNCPNPLTLSNNGTANCTFNFSYAPAISGNVWLDNAGMGISSTTGISGATVRLYNSSGTFVTSTTSSATGAYSFGNRAAGTYYVTVAAPSSGSALAEQTYAAPGSGNIGVQGGSSYGPICLGVAPTYTPQNNVTASNWSAQSSGTTCFGGRQGSVADSNVATLTSNEHVTRVISSTTGSDISNVDFGFSYNVVTNTNDSGQGSFRQFLANANTLAGANAMRFVPTVVTNTTSGANSWWKVTAASVFPTLTGANAANTTIDGVAYSNVDGSSLLTLNSAVINSSQVVGYGSSQSTIPALSGPQLEINAPTTATFTQTLLISAANNIIQNVSVTGGNSHTIRATTGASAFTLQNSVVGMTPVGADSTQVLAGAQNAAVRVGDASGAATTAGLTGTIYHNAIRSAGANISFYGVTGLTSGQYVINNNFALGVTGTNINAIDILSSPNVNLTSNYITSGKGANVQFNASSGGIATGNTSVSSGGGPTFYFNNATSNAQAIGNSFQSATGYGMRIDASSNNNLVRANQMINNASGGIAVATNSNGNQITQNIFGDNGRNAIDLNGDGVSINSTACLNTAGAATGNSGLARPVINSTSLSGSTLTIGGTLCATGTYTIEVYKAVGVGVANSTANNDMGADNRLAGEGTIYLGSITGQTGGNFSGSLSVSGVTSTDTISVTAIRTTTGGTGVIGDTSEFSVNAGFAQIQGTVFEDVVGNQGPQVARSGVTVCGFLDNGDGIANSSDALIQCTTTAADGSYTLSSVVSGTYWIAVQASTVTPSQGGTGLAEQVYGPIGSQCVNSSFVSTTLTTAGACYGGKAPAAADAFTGTLATLASAKHLSKVTVGTTSVTAQNFGFSFNVVTNVNDSGQGSLRQFITNANSITGANTMRFIPAVAANQTSGSNSWWRATLATALPTITGTNGANTTVDGIAYSNSDGVTVVNSNSGLLGDTTTKVGRATSALSGVNAPEFEIKGALTLGAASPTVQNMGVFSGGINISSGASSVVIQNNIIGSTAGAFVDPGAASRSGTNIFIDYTSVTSLNGLTIQNNLIGFAGYAGIQFNNVNTYSNVLISNNQISNNGLVSSVDDGIQIVNVPNISNMVINHNLFKSNNNKGIELYSLGGPVQVTNNTFTSNGLVGSASPGLGVHKTNTSLVTVKDNIVTNNGGQGILVNNSAATLITQNEFSGNGGNAIDLAGNGVTLNTNACTNANTASSANTGLARPTIKSLRLSGTTLLVTGTLCATGTFTIELYKASSGTGDTGSDSLSAGEGSVYLGSLTGQSGGTFSGSLSGISGVTTTDAITAIAIRTVTGGTGVVGDTSEFSINANFTAIAGTIFEDVVGNQGAQIGLSGVTVCSILDDGDGILNATDTIEDCQVTASDGSYNLSAAYIGNYWIAVKSSTISPTQGGSGVAEQVYGPVGGQCMNSALIVSDLTTAGPCYGGRNPSGVDGFDGTAATLTGAKHIAKLTVGTSNVSSQNFGFSFNVVTNVNDNGQGSLRQFMLNANNITGSNQMRFVPAVAANKGTWWQVATSSSLPTITGVNGNNTVIEGTAYSYLDGTSIVDKNTASLSGQSVGRNSTAIGSWNMPELEILSDSGVSGGVVSSNSDNFTLQNIGLNSSVNYLTGSSSYINFSNASNLTVTHVITGITMSGGSQSTKTAVPFAVSNVGGTGTISASNFTSNGGAGIINNAPSSVVGNWVVQSSVMESLKLSGTTTQMVVQNNAISNGVDISSAAGSNQIVNNSVNGSGGAVRITIGSTSSNLIQNNILANSTGGAGVTITTGIANKISQNIFGNNNGNAIDLGNNGVSVNSDVCTASGTGGANNNIARPTIYQATLHGSSMDVEGLICNSGVYTIEFYKSSSGAGDVGSDGLAAGEGIVYLGSLTNQSDIEFNGSLSGITGLAVGDTVSVIAIRTNGTSVGDTSEFSTNFTVTNPNFGSAPDSYKTLLSSGGAEHYIDTRLSLGTTTPASTDGAPVIAPAAALGGDGVVLPFPQLTLGTTNYSVSVKVNNETLYDAILVGWIDFNRNGVFDAAEGLSVLVPAQTSNATYVLTWNNVQSLGPKLGPTYARFRISTVSSISTSTPAGILADGEVEDYGGVGVLEIIGRNIKGSVFDDINRNGALDATEGGTGLTLYVKAVTNNNGTCSGNAQQVATVDPVTGAYELIGLAPGNYCVIVSNDNTAANITPYTPTGWSYTSNSPGQLFENLSALADKTGKNFGLSNSQLISGNVFYDVGTNSGVAYNGVQDGGEAGISGVTVTLTGSGFSAQAVTTAADGSYTLPIPDTASGTLTVTVGGQSSMIHVSKKVVGVTDNSGASTFSQMSFDLTGLNFSAQANFGIANVPDLLPDTIEDAVAGGITYHTHSFVAKSPGTVTFAYQNQVAHPTNPLWVSGLYWDKNCDGVVDSTDMLLTSGITLAVGDQMCILSQIGVPQNSLIGDQLVQDVVASFNYGSSGQTSTLKVNELTQVSLSRALKLEKAVNSLNAQPGDVLTYTITYTNQDIKPITGIVINDSTPNYTVYVGGSSQCVSPQPIGVTCAITSEPLANTQGYLVWTIGGSLLPSKSGQVTYQVQVLSQ